MRLLLCLTFASIAWAMLVPLAPSVGAADLADKLVRAVQELGTPDRDQERFDVLATAPQRSVPLLVEQLHPLPRRTYFTTSKTAQSRHVIACLRALHYISGKTFSAETKAKLSDDERQFLDFAKTMGDSNPDHALHFFGVWMSRDAEIVAPTDVQKAIIEQWRTYAKEVAHQETSKLAKPAKPAAQAKDDWYWYG